MKTREILLAAVALATFAPQGGAQAQTSAPVWRQVQSQGQTSGVMPVREIIAAVRAQLGDGIIIGVPRLEDNGGRLTYKVRWRRPDGLVLDYWVDARSGRVIGQAG